MFSKTIAVLLLAAYSATPGDAFGDDKWNNLTATWPTTGNDGNHPLPLTTTAAYDEGWTDIKGAKPSPDVISALHSDENVRPGTFNIKTCVGFEGNSRIVVCYNSIDEPVAILLGFPVKSTDVEGMPVDYRNHVGIFEIELNDEAYFAARFYFTVDAVGKRRIWVEDSTGIAEIPTTAEGLSGTPFLKKNCVPTMGTHYYQLDPTSDCTQFYPWVPLLDGDELKGLAFQAIGDTTIDSNRVWNEYIPARGVTVACNDAPDCFTAYVEKFNIISMHVWFLTDIKTLVCN